MELPSKIRFDGHGLNNASNGFSTRLATLTHDARGSEIGEELAKRYNIYSAFLQALEAIAERPKVQADSLTFEDAREELNSMIELARKVLLQEARGE